MKKVHFLYNSFLVKSLRVEQHFLLVLLKQYLVTLKNKFPNSQSIFLLPPDKEELERRIRNRGTEKEEAIKKRLSRANYEISVSNQFDFALTNHNVDETSKKIIKLIKT